MKKCYLRVNEQRSILHEIRKRKANILRRNCLLKQVIEGKIKEEMEMARRRGRRRKKLLDDHKDRRGYSHLKEKALDRTMWRHRFGGGFVPVVRQDTEWMNVNYLRSQWPRGLRRRSSDARLLRMWFRIPPGTWMFVCCECCVLSGRGLCDGLITRPDES